MKIQVGDLVEWIEFDTPYDVGIVLRIKWNGYPYIWWAGDQDCGHCDVQYLGEHLFVIGGSDECR